MLEADSLSADAGENKVSDVALVTLKTTSADLLRVMATHTTIGTLGFSTVIKVP